MSDFFKKIKQYLAYPEMKILWLFLFLVSLIVIIDVIYLEEIFWILVSIIILASIGTVIAVNSIRTARLTERLRLEKARLDTIISSMDDGVLVYDQDFRILLFNPAAASIFGIPAQEAIGQQLSPESVKNEKLKELAMTVFQSLAPQVVRQTAEGVYPQIVDLSFTDPEQELRVTTDRVLNSQGQVTGFLKIIRDRTREIGLLKSKSEFIAVAAHQLRTPLSAVSWTFESLKKDTLNDNQKELADTGIAASNNLLKIVEDLLNVSTIEEGKFGYNFQEIGLIGFIQGAVDSVSPVAREYQVKVFMEPFPEGEIAVTMDPEKIGLVMANLLENAIKYNVANGQVVVSIERRNDGPFMQVNVSDTGMGISEEARQKLFTKFFRAENAITKETAGSGLGLYIVKNIIKRHGGQIWVDSEVGRGTTFHFTIPTDSRLIPPKEIGFME